MVSSLLQVSWSKFLKTAFFSSNITDGAYTVWNPELHSCQDKLSTLHAINYTTADMVQRDMTAKWQSQEPQVQIAFSILNDFSHRRIILLSSYLGNMALNLSFALQVQWCLMH